MACCLMVTLLGIGFGLTYGNSDLRSPHVSKAAYEEAIAILKKSPIVDGHNDFPMALRLAFDNNLTNLNFDSNLSEVEPFKSSPLDHTDLPRLRSGQVGGQFWSAYISCKSQFQDAVQVCLEQIDVIKRLVSDYPNDLKWVTSAKGIEEAFTEKKIASLIGVESGHAIGSSLAVLRSFYELGVRYMTLTHSCNTPWADSSVAEDGETSLFHNGLTAFGRSVVFEMNRLGMLVDLAHVSSKTMEDVLHVSKAPVIFSHSSARAIYNISRNVPDDILRKVTENGGIVMVNFYSCFVGDCNSRNISVLDVKEHINHIRQVAGVDHVGIGADFNGVTETPVGLENVSKYPNLFAALIEDQNTTWTNEDLEKLASRNLIRVLKTVEKVRDSLADEKPYQNWIPINDLEGHTECISSA